MFAELKAMFYPISLSLLLGIRELSEDREERERVLAGRDCHAD
jgi:hypothetical protein